MSFGERLKELRIEDGLTQIQLAEILDVSKSNISKYEAGSVEPNLEIIIKIALHFAVDTDYLLGLTNKRIKDTDLEWRFPHAQNRLGSILARYREKEMLSISNFAKKLDISEPLEEQLEQGQYVPSMPLIERISKTTGYEIDYLTGANNRSNIPLDDFLEIDSKKASIHLFELDNHFRSRFEELCIKHRIDKENVLDTLHISYEDFLDIRWNRMPTLPELLRLAYAFNVSIDYLIGKTDTPFSSLSKDELELVLNYRDCIEPYKQNIRERASTLSYESIKNSSVAADEQLKKTGTTNSAK